MSAKHQHRLKATVEKRGPSAVIHLSDALERKLTFGPGSKLRVEGTIEDVPFALALMPAPGRNHYLMLSRRTLEKTGALIGDTITVRFNVVSAERVAIPEELEAALATNRDVQKRWETLTPGRKRTWATYVDRAKRSATRTAKAAEVIDRVRRGLVNPRDPWP